MFSLYFIGAVGGEGGDEDDKEKEEEAERERQEAIREAEERRKEKHRKMEEEREKMRQEIRDKVSNDDFAEAFAAKTSLRIALEMTSIFIHSYFLFNWNPYQKFCIATFNVIYMLNYCSILSLKLFHRTIMF